MSRDLDRPDDRRFDDDDRYDCPPRSNGVAVAALVLGILSVCLGVFAGVPAVICGILGLTRSSRVRSGKGMAIAGLTLGAIMTLLNVVALPLAVSRVRQAAARAKDSNNLKQTALAVLNYEAVNRRLPSAFARRDDGEPNRGLSWRVEMLSVPGGGAALPAVQPQQPVG
jgi:Domain of unknown function (DUF4190)/Protein of unknown function (DUF1559)